MNRRDFLKNTVAGVGTMAFGSLVIPRAAFSLGKAFKIVWSHYTGWEPWAYADEFGLLKKWADKYGINIELTLVNDYVESINLYTSGEYIGCTMTNMDALTIPAVGGVDSSAIIIGDFSNGNDGIVARGGVTDMQGLRDKTVYLVQFSVSHYLLARALAMYGMSEKDISTVNMNSDADILGVFKGDPGCIAVTWNPALMQARNEEGATLLFTSKKIPGEIIDMMVVRTDAPDTLKRALTGAWFETMEVMTSKGLRAEEAIRFMASKAGGTLPEFIGQLDTTAMFYKPSDALKFVQAPMLKQTMEYVQKFSFDHGLFGQGITDKNFIGIELTDKSTIGNGANVQLRFDASYMQLAEQNKL